MNLPFIRINPLGVVVLCGVLLFLVYFYTGANEKNSVPTVVSLKHLLSVSVTAAELGGLKVKEIRKSVDLKQKSKGKTKEGANDPVTHGDLLSHKAILYTLKSSFPNIEVVSEEHDDSDINSLDINRPIPPWSPIDKFSTDIVVPVKDVLIWIDPLDATQEYTENLLQYVTTMVCVAIKGKPIIGIVHKPFQNSTVWGWAGKGISDPNYASGEKHDSKKSPTIIVSRSHAGKVKEVARAAFGPETEVVPAGGAGYKSLEVIEGKADAYIHVTLIKKWDICAGNALFNAVGGKMTTLDGSPIDYGDSTAVKNEKGLVAALYEHEKFLSKLSTLSS